MRGLLIGENLRNIMIVKCRIKRSYKQTHKHRKPKTLAEVERDRKNTYVPLKYKPPRG